MMKRYFKTTIFTVIALLMVLMTGCTMAENNKTGQQPETEKSVTLTISVAASLKDAMEEVQKRYLDAKPNVSIKYNFGSSGSLQQQIEQGAPVDVFVSAATKQMKALQEKSLIINETKKDLLKNSVVLIVPKDSVNVSDFQSLTSDSVKKIGLGEPASVPAGQYGKDVLTSVKVWDNVQSKLVLAKDVHQVLSWVESGDADAGIVYMTDAKISDKIKIAVVAPEGSHSPVVYPVAVLKDSKQAEASKEFVDFLFGEIASQVFEKYGFTSLANQ
jgi:molybdate transport system substrate-binding protein